MDLYYIPWLLLLLLLFLISARSELIKYRFNTKASSSSSSSSQQKKWDVFISFRGRDVRRSFLAFLFKALKEKGIDAFMDENLHKGAEITPSLLQTIQESIISIVIFSENYADSPWCLDELVQINECREESGQIVVPVFYRVDPADVQDLKGTFAEALTYKLKKEHKHKLKRWRCALETISNELSGWVSNEIRDEEILVQKIVDDVWEKLDDVTTSYASYEDKLVGIDSRSNKVNLLLDLKVNDRRTLGIWGMAGIGKTTLAGKVYSQIKAEFDGHCFVSNVNEEIRRKEPIGLRDKIICELLGDKNLKIGTPFLSDRIKKRLRRKKVLIVFDDVVRLNHLNLLAGNCNLYGEGSRIIITSTDRQVLVNVCDEEHIYEVEKLIGHEALQLFSLYAFHQIKPKEDYAEISEKLISYAQGNPLGLRVLGSNLYGMDIEDWECELEKLKSIPDMEIQEVLKLSYDRLDRDAKDIFLDIACFFKRETKKELEIKLASFGFHARIGIRRLLDKSLITISDPRWGEVTNMHNLLQHMGKEIVNEESKQPCGRSRLWSSKDILHVFRTNSGTGSIEGILLDMSEVGSIELCSTAFMKMHRLRFIKFYNCDNSEGYILRYGLDFLPEELKFLQWDHYPLKYFPLNFRPDILTELHLSHSHLEQLCDGDEPFTNMRVMDLSYSDSLVRISNSFQAPNLEKLFLNGCKCEIPSSLQKSRKLTELELEGCINIQSENLEFPCKLRVLKLGGTPIKQLSSSIGYCSQLVRLRLNGCIELKDLPSCIGQLKTLQILDFSNCSNLSCLPESICQLKHLQDFSVKDCSKLKELPSNLGELRSLRELEADRSGIKTLPSSINQLSELSFLCCRGCEGLKILPSLSGLNSLLRLDLGMSGMLEIPASIGSLASLTDLYLDGNNFESIFASIKQISKLEMLDLSNCKKLSNLPELPLSWKLNASNCTSLEFASCSFLFQEKFNTSGEDRMLDFANCTNLNKQVRLKIMEDGLSTYDPNKKHGMGLLIPGGEVPPKMRYRTNGGSHISFELDKHQDIIGFCFCAVIDHKADDKHWIWCHASFAEACGKIHEFDYAGVCLGEMLNSEHVFMWYGGFNRKEHFAHASFDFVYEDKHDNRVTGMIECGVHPIGIKF